jgi:hypothetical protein
MDGARLGRTEIHRTRPLTLCRGHARRRLRWAFIAAIITTRFAPFARRRRGRRGRCEFGDRFRIVHFNWRRVFFRRMKTFGRFGMRLAKTAGRFGLMFGMCGGLLRLGGRGNFAGGFDWLRCRRHFPGDGRFG